MVKTAATRDAGAGAEAEGGAEANEWLAVGPAAWDVVCSTRRVARRVERKLDRLLSVLGLTFTHLEALHVVWDRHSTTPGWLARELRISRQGAQQVLEKLAQRGLVEMFVADGGRRCARLTPFVREQLMQGSRWLTEAFGAVDRIPVAHRRALLEALARLEVAITARRAAPWWLD
jgi:DNA-binding MarR family transcriptional regulator